VASDVEVKVLSTTAMKLVFEELAPRYQREIGHRLSVSLGPSAQLEARLDQGESADVAILTSGGARQLAAHGKLVTASLTDVARSPIGVGVRKGAPKPDISSVEAFRRAMLAARAIACSKPAGGGASGAHMAQVFERLGIAEAMNAKAKYGAGGVGGLSALFVARGEADIAIQQITELMMVDGIDVVGPLPADIQSITLFTAGVPNSAGHADAGRALIDFLTAPTAKAVIKAKGLEPV